MKDNVMVLAEVRKNVVHPTTGEMLAWARLLAGKLNVDVECVVLGANKNAHDVDIMEQLFNWGADRVLWVQHSQLNELLITPAASLLVRTVRQQNPSIVIAPATTYGRTLMPVAAAKLGTGLTADCTVLDIDPKDNLLLQTRPAIGGNIMATIKTARTKPQMATVRPRTIKPVAWDASKRELIKLKHNDLPLNWRERLISFTRGEQSGVNLENSDLILAGGKGLKNKDNYLLLEQLAQLLGAGLGATRYAVEADWAPFAYQIGLTGKTVAPKVYVAVGVSGKIQHLAGMLTSEFVIAINDDPLAQIFQVADLGIVGDAPTMVTKLIQAVSKDNSLPREGAKSDVRNNA